MAVVAENKRSGQEFRWSVRRKTDAVMRLLRGEDLDTVARKLRIEAHRADPVPAGHVVRRGNHPALRRVSVAAYHHRLALELRMPQHLDGCDELAQVDVEDATRHDITIERSASDGASSAGQPVAPSFDFHREGRALRRLPALLRIPVEKENHRAFELVTLVDDPSTTVGTDPPQAVPVLVVRVDEKAHS